MLSLLNLILYFFEKFYMHSFLTNECFFQCVNQPTSGRKLIYVDYCPQAPLRVLQQQPLGLKVRVGNTCFLSKSLGDVTCNGTPSFLVCHLSLPIMKILGKRLSF